MIKDLEDSSENKEESKVEIDCMQIFALGDEILEMEVGYFILGIYIFGTKE
ncbi:hypothetical protein PBT90_07525 [Algoriphagus halophytocola]|uniref:Uncharacterized protein n=1 Tax=Algoriphagus halophytocola TaxID=2991499 RepID=A0ABY6MKP1_9BACT|nr:MULTISPECIES: hypothetical protein [unclassified Algoriphagus]UZD23236.1 hypothetical protein OM944_01840 [Algoriphagus sp. TR-M5]WBL44530.1 hypothetical protein PBT90_07525 [Algoriphagus sp. TR-M9]